MIQKLLANFTYNKYRLTMFALLAGASVFSVAIWMVRANYTGTIDYYFLNWNLFLAWIPFLISYFTYTLTSIPRKWMLGIVPAALLWLLFFPNAPYILTDFKHIGRWPDVPVWYDVLLVIWFSFTGVLLGMVSLFLMQEVVRRELGRWAGWGFVTIVAVLSSVGVYVGRFLRWNSWDVFSDPLSMVQHTLQGMLDPSLKFLGFTGLFGGFFLFLYVTLYTFGHLLLERQINEKVNP